MADEGADGLFLRRDRLQRLRDRGIGGKFAGIDAALEIGERDHEALPVMTRQVTESLGMEQAYSRHNQTVDRISGWAKLHPHA